MPPKSPLNDDGSDILSSVSQFSLHVTYELNLRLESDRMLAALHYMDSSFKPNALTLKVFKVIPRYFSLLLHLCLIHYLESLKLLDFVKFDLDMMLMPCRCLKPVISVHKVHEASSEDITLPLSKI